MEHTTTWLSELSWQVLIPEFFFLTTILMVYLTAALKVEWLRHASYLSITLLVILIIVVFRGLFGHMYHAFHFALVLDNTALIAMIYCIVAGVLISVALWPKLQADKVGTVALSRFGMLFMGMFACSLLTSTLDLITMFIALEALSLVLYILIAGEQGAADRLEASMKYFLMGSLSAALFLYGSSLIYGATGSFSLVDIRRHPPNDPLYTMLYLAGMAFLLVGLGFKISLVPFHQWTPEVYQGAPASLSGFMSTAVKIAAFTAILRIFADADTSSVGTRTQWLLGGLSVLTMTVGNLNALRQTQLKRLLAYSSIAHVGYILVGIVASGTEGRAAVWFYLLAYLFMNLGAFLVLELLEHLNVRSDMESHRGLFYRYPGWAAALSIFLLSLTGIPATAGFLAKFWVFRAALESHWLSLVIAAIINSIVAAFYYFRWIITLVEPSTRPVPTRRPINASWSGDHVGYALAVALCVFFTLQLGLWPSRFLSLVRAAFPWPG